MSSVPNKPKPRGVLWLIIAIIVIVLAVFGYKRMHPNAGDEAAVPAAAPAAPAQEAPAPAPAPAPETAPAPAPDTAAPAPAPAPEQH